MLYVLIAIPVILGLCIGIIFPIVAIVKCINSNLSSKAKTWWIVGMVLTLPITAYIYFIIYARTTARRVLSVLALAFVLFGVALNWPVLKKKDEPLVSAIEKDNQNSSVETLGQKWRGELKQDINKNFQAIDNELQKSNERYQELQSKSVQRTIDYIKLKQSPTTQDSLGIIIKNLEELIIEIKEPSTTEDFKWQDPATRQLTTLARKIANDNQITPEELQQWEQTFANRRQAQDNIHEANIKRVDTTISSMQRKFLPGGTNTQDTASAVIADLKTFRDELNNNAYGSDDGHEFWVVQELTDLAVQTSTPEALPHWQEAFANRKNVTYVNAHHHSTPVASPQNSIPNGISNNPQPNPGAGQ